MGVAGLHKLLLPFAQTKHVSDFCGQRLAVDGYAWLHRAAASCADDLFHGRETTKLVQSIDTRIRLYEHHGVELFFVFDGMALGMKSEVERERRQRRKTAADRAGKQPSYQHALSGLDITAKHAAMVIALLKQRQIRYVVAPFEADSQMVWLENEGIVHGIVSEDSDLLVFGAQRLLTKSDPQAGTCVELCRRNFAPQYRDLRYLRALAIVSGCDYCPGIHGLGPVKAGALVAKFGGDLEAVLASLVRDRRASEKFVATARKADLAFRYAQVWDMGQRLVTSLAEADEEARARLTDEIIGRQLTRPEAHRIAVGSVDPHDVTKSLVVSPLIAQYVSRARPYAVRPKPKLDARKVIDRRLGASTVPLQKSPFFANKENLLYAKLERPAGTEPTVRDSVEAAAPSEAKPPMETLKNSTNTRANPDTQLTARVGSNLATKTATIADPPLTVSTKSTISDPESASSESSDGSARSLKRPNSFESPPAAKIPSVSDTSRFAFLNKFRFTGS